MIKMYWEKTNTIKGITEILLDASGEIGLEVNTEWTKYVIVSYNQNVRQNHSLLIANKSFQSVTKFNCLGTTVTNQNCIHEEIKSILNLGNVCYLLYRCETWSLSH
jgi:hypothetical protein